MVTAAGGHGLRRGPSARGGPSDPRGGCTKLLPRQYMLSESDQAPQAVVTITPSAGHLRPSSTLRRLLVPHPRPLCHDCHDLGPGASGV